MNQDITELVKADLDERRELGIRSYGRPLSAHMGEDMEAHLYQELLDAVKYLRARLEERGKSPYQCQWRDRALRAEKKIADFNQAINAGFDTCKSESLATVSIEWLKAQLGHLTK